MVRSTKVTLLCVLFVLTGVRASLAQTQTLTLLGNEQLSIEPTSVDGLTYGQGPTSTTATITLLGGTFGGLFTSVFDWSNVTFFGLLMSMPAPVGNASFTIDFFNSNIMGENPQNFYIARFTGTTAGVSAEPLILALTKETNFIPPDGGSGGLDNFTNVAGMQFTWNATPPEEGTEVTLGGLAGFSGQVEPVITGVGFSENGFTMTWSGTGFLPVIVQRCESLETGPWVPIAQGVATGEFTDTDPPAGKAFYRVVVP